jgi:hypothetical protein
VTGSETDVCVSATIIAAVNHGYRVILRRTAAALSPPLPWAASAEEILAMWRWGVQLGRPQTMNGTWKDWVDEKPVERYTVDSKPMRPDDLRHLRRQSAAIPTVARWNSARWGA